MKTTLLQYLDEIAEIEELKENATNEEKRIHYNKCESALNKLLIKISSAVETLKEFQQQWLQLIQKSTGLYDRVLRDDNSFTGVLQKGRNALTKIKVLKEEMIAIRNQAEH